jgi:hypothetical protein
MTDAGGNERDVGRVFGQVLLHVFGLLLDFIVWTS